MALTQLFHIGLRHACGRQQRKSERGKQRDDEADGENAPVQAHVAEALGACAGQSNCGEPPPGEKQSGGTRGQRRDETLDHELADLTKRPAPSAARTASSRRRVTMCARMMLDTFAHAMQTTITAMSERSSSTAVMLAPSSR